jgi:hypothetical protein
VVRRSPVSPRTTVRRWSSRRGSLGDPRRRDRRSPVAHAPDRRIPEGSSDFHDRLERRVDRGAGVRGNRVPVSADRGRMRLIPRRFSAAMAQTHHARPDPLRSPTPHTPTAGPRLPVLPERLDPCHGTAHRRDPARDGHATDRPTRAALRCHWGCRWPRGRRWARWGRRGFVRRRPGPSAPPPTTARCRSRRCPTVLIETSQQTRAAAFLLTPLVADTIIR